MTPLAWDALLSPHRLALVGASERNPFAERLVRNMERIGFSGDILCVNPNRRRAFDRDCHPDLASLPEPPDCVAVSVPADGVQGVVDEGIRLGVRAFVVNSAGFADAGPAGSERQDALAASCARAGALLLGPNCMGLVSFVDRVATFGAPLPPRLPAGHVAVVSQSGSAAVALLNAARDFGFTIVASSGNEAVLTAEDLIGRSLDEGRTRVIVAFVEALRRPRAFLELARRAEGAGVPLVVLKVGTSGHGAEAALTHTGALVGDAQVIEAVFRDSGVVQVGDLDELIETVELLSRVRRRPRGPRVAIVGLSGGELAMAADVAASVGLPLARLRPETHAALRAALHHPDAPVANPVDLGLARRSSSEFESACAECVTTLAADDGVDLVAVAQDAPRVLDPGQVPLFRQVVAGAASASRSVAVPVVVFTYVSAGFHDDVVRPAREAEMPVLQGARPALRAMAHLGRWAVRPRAAVMPEPDPARFRAALGDAAMGPSVLSERTAKRLLAAYGVRVTRERLARSAAEAAAIAVEIGPPVVLKVESPGVVHKRAVGGARTGVRDAEEARAAFADVVAAVRTALPGARVDGVLVAEQVPRGVELFVGAHHDDGFGPVVAIGLGGILVEAIGQLTFALPPATTAEALTLLERSPWFESLRGPTDRPTIDVGAVADAVCRIGRLAIDGAPMLTSLDVNPLVVGAPGSGCWVVDATAVIAGVA